MTENIDKDFIKKRDILIKLKEECASLEEEKKLHRQNLNKFYQIEKDCDERIKKKKELLSKLRYESYNSEDIDEDENKNKMIINKIKSNCTVIDIIIATLLFLLLLKKRKVS